MKKLLYVTCDLKPVGKSRSHTVGDKFLYEYNKWHPDDEIHMLDLYRDYIQHIDADVVNGLERIRLGHHFAVLTPDEQLKIGRIWRLIDQFSAADKYVFVTPVQNMEIPAELRMYIDIVCVANNAYRFAYSQPNEFLCNQPKKFLLIHSIDGAATGKAKNNSISYIKSAMKLMGIEECENIEINGQDKMSDNSKWYIDEVVKKALMLAVRF